jgi:hypothetical protein
MRLGEHREYRFAWWHQGLLMYDHEYEWSAGSSEIERVDFSRWIGQEPSRSVTFVSPGGELFGSSEAPLVVEALEAEPAIEADAESVGDFDLIVHSGRVDLAASGGMDDVTTIEEPPGQWRARWSGFGETAATEQAFPTDVLNGTDRPDRYLLQLWPLEEPRPVVVHRS